MSTAKVENGATRTTRRTVNGIPSSSSRTAAKSARAVSSSTTKRSTQTSNIQSQSASTSSDGTATKRLPTSSISSRSTAVSSIKSASSRPTSASTSGTSKHDNSPSKSSLFNLDQLLTILKSDDIDKIDGKSIDSLLGLLGVSSVKQLEISLLSSQPPSSTSKPTRIRTTTASSATTIDDVSNQPLELNSKHASISKSIINATLLSLNKVTATGWKWIPTQSQKSSTSASTSTGKNSKATNSTSAKPQTTSRPTTSSNATSSSSTSTPLENQPVLCLIDIFRISIRALMITIRNADKVDDKKDQAIQLQFILVVLTFVKKLAGFQMHRVLLQELSLARNVLLTLYEHEDLFEKDQSLSDQTQLMLYPLPTSTNDSSNLLAYIMEAQTLATSSLLSLTFTNDLSDSKLPLPFDSDSSPLNWQSYLLKNMSLYNLDSKDRESLESSSNRFCYVLERSISSFLDGVTASTSSSSESTSSSNLELSLNLRLLSLKLLSFVSEIQEKRDAFWDRGSRAVASFFRNSLSSTDLDFEEKKVLAVEVYEKVRKFCLELVEDVKSVDKVRFRSGKSNEKGKVVERIADGEGFLRFLQNWNQISKKSGISKDLDLIAGLIYSTSSQSSSNYGEDSSVISRSSSPIKRMNSSPSKSISSSSPTKPTSKNRHTSSPLDQIQATKLVAHTSALLTKVIVSMDASLSQDDSKLTDDSRIDLVRILETGINALDVEKIDFHCISMINEDGRKKWFRSLGQLRRRALKIFDREFKRKTKDEEDESVFKSNNILLNSRSLLLTIVSQFEIHLKDSSLLLQSSNSNPDTTSSPNSSSSSSSSSLPSQSDLIEDSIHILRILSQSVFKLEDFESHEESKVYLERGFDLIVSSEDSTSRDEADQQKDGSRLQKSKAENLGFLASSFYFLGGQLFAKKRIASSISFISRACEITESSNRIYSEITDTTREEENTAQETRNSTLVRRYEHLACAYQNVQQYQLSFENYLKAIDAVSCQTFESIEKSASENGISRIFEKENDFNRLASLLKSAMEISVFHLLMEQKIHVTLVEEKEPGSSNLTQFLISKGLSKALVGSLLEFCLIALDSKMQQEEVPFAISSLLFNLQDLYEEDSLPIRRARILLRKIEIEMYLPIEIEENEDEVTAEKRTLEDRRALANEALRLLKSEDLGLDASLARFVPQYEASAHMLLVLLEQRADTERSRQQVVHHANQASAILRSLLSPLPAISVAEHSPLRVSNASKEEESPKGRKLPPTTPRRPAAGRGKPLKNNIAPPQATTLNPVTPPSKSKNLISSSPIGSPFSESKTSATASQYDNVERLCAQLELTFEIVNTFGHTLASIDLLKVLRRLNQTARSPSLGRDGYLRASASLTKQYLWLGKTARAGSVISKALASISASASSPHNSLAGVSRETKFRCLLANADYLCRIGCIEQSIQKYEEAVTIAKSIDDNVKGAAWQRLIAKGISVERQILAADTFSAIALARGDLVSAIKASYEGVRNSIKASRMLSKVTASTSKDQGGDSLGPLSDPPSDSGTEPAVAPASVEYSKKAPRLATFALTTLHWRLCKNLLLGYLQISRLNAVRGSARDSNAFATECVDLASSLSVPLFQSRALVQRAEVRLMLGQLETGEADLAQGLALLDEDWIPEAIGLACLRGDSLSKANSFAEALVSYSAGQTTLRTLSAAVSDLEAILPTPRNNQKAGASLGGSATPASRRTSLATQDAILPDVQGLLLRRQAWLLHLLGREREAQSFMEQASALEIDEEGKVDDSLVKGRISLRKALQQLQGHQILSMLPEAAVSLPMASSSSSKSLASSAKGAVSALSASETAFKSALTSGKNSSHITQVREASLSLALVSTLQATLGKGSKAGVLAAAGFIDGGASVTLDRELLEAIERKLKPGTREDPFFAFEKAKIQTIITKGKSRSHLALDELVSEEEDEDEEEQNDKVTANRKYWTSVKERRLGLSGKNSLSLSSSTELELPSNWTVISISLVKDQSTLMLSRQGGGGRDPVLFSLPLNRQSKREGEDEEDEFTFAKALEELNDVVGSCNTAVSAAKDLEGMDARKAWWTNRRALDSRLGELLGAMETKWLGAFKSIFSDPLTASPQEIRKLRSELDGIIGKACFPSDREPPKPKVNDTVFETFAGLSPTCSDEELEDMIHFYIDAYQFNGIPVAEDEVEMDLLVVQIRAKLEAFRGVCRREGSSADHHMFLILDKDTSPFPWESMPVLRNRPVSRIPSTSFLQDRIELSKIRNKSQSEFNSSSSRMVLNRSKTFYVLNPSQDLTKSQETFSPWLESESRDSGWKGIVGRAPYMNEFSSALSSNDLMLYFGHSGAEQYIRSNQLRELPSCSATMLWGCSSGILRDQGEFDRTGTPYNYFMAGCPSLVGNLWDTTDREIDGVAMEVMKKLGLKKEEDEDQGKGKEKEKEKPRKTKSSSEAEKLEKDKRPMSIVRAVAESRNACKLPFLTGAAVVCYGIPVYWE